MDSKLRSIPSRYANRHEIKVSATGSSGAVPSFGSVYTHVPNYTSNGVPDFVYGDAIAYVESATNGAQFLIKRPGLYHVYAVAGTQAAGAGSSVSVAVVRNITAAQGSVANAATVLANTAGPNPNLLAFSSGYSAGGNDIAPIASNTVWLDEGDVIQSLYNIDGNFSNVFWITKVA